MPDLTAKRTLVKSPPELWEELSEVDRLAKHLGAFGEITITKLEPEHTVAWEGERASGTVSIEPSGWGTKVTLRAELPEGEPEPAPEPEPEPVLEAPAEQPLDEAQHVDDHIRRLCVEPPAAAEAEAAEPEQGPEPIVAADTPEQKPRRGFWGWLFRSRTEPVEREPEPVAVEPSEPLAAEPVSEPVAAEPEPEPVAVEPEPVAVEPDPAAPEAALESDEPASAPADAGADAADPAAALDPERVLVILDEALDALGAAHHRPFSRG